MDEYILKMPDQASQTDDLCDVIPKLIWDARTMEERAEATETELAGVRAQLQAADRVHRVAKMRELDRLNRLLYFGCRECGAPADHLCKRCIQPLCSLCIEQSFGRMLAHDANDVAEVIASSYKCFLCNEETA